MKYMKYSTLFLSFFTILNSYSQMSDRTHSISPHVMGEKTLPTKEVTEEEENSYFLEEYPEVWKRSVVYTVAVAEAMPENLYNYKVYPDGMSFKEQQLHIVDNISFLGGLITEETRLFYSKEDLHSLKKAQVIEILNHAFNHVANLKENIAPGEISQKIVFKKEEVSKENIFYLIRNHVTHHRAQSVVYLRMQGLAVPEYVGW